MCRRGMKELDVLLESFIHAHSEDLAAGQWPQLERMLELEDDLLWDCLRGAGSAPDPEFDSLILEIGSNRARRP